MSTALITGASGGIGKAFAEELAARKTNLVLVARSVEKLTQIATQLQQKHQIQVEVIAKDLTEPNATNDVFDAIKTKGLTIDLLVNNAGFGDYGDFAEREGERQLNMIQLNIIALVDLTHKFLPLMRQRRSGSIINVSSIAGFQPMPYLSVYAATKAFVLSFSEALWAENRDYGVHVLVVCPGPTETDFFTEARFPSTLAGSNNKIATPEEVVRDALKALEKGDSTVVSGGLANQLIVNMHRFLPRESLVSAIARQFKNNS
ncbi:SDR family oxidoreductase [Anabaena cylindrica FACHB-243]|uniref:Testosterone 17-beta-dehydrogenase (NADP(+)) n=1 Tax=Anabaena cylindrica (strain ATCC 27899 / PCC 7122) TaxID=272123 RepID=K9ZHN1_ANACC|nr:MULTISPECIES: SDR family oxidoreductase [Anabaena]AFZ58738.1 Testosterone 17-beta-dehydrogenase (NADP(+)) [Anabaena cylindrica PCC 7122]MBD2420080.1 SDR family oxidoreductase [Anabaena cylindrica FACHB-243]MBY5282949.1 SDR family oxidoreductase [Anabaena sp. CCAP 1446/1C]MBY5306552.1 SDR family oxidoreductase [Anabaena sp. CCAP 1446/1C]MCM2407023.1 SDR family oxidoreductase [Anabaena sp. CCAP 1446/1C]